MSTTDEKPPLTPVDLEPPLRWTGTAVQSTLLMPSPGPLRLEATQVLNSLSGFFVFDDMIRKLLFDGAYNNSSVFRLSLTSSI